MAAEDALLVYYLKTPDLFHSKENYFRVPLTTEKDKPMALEPDARTPSEPSASNWWDNYDATYVTPEALAAVPEMPPVPPVTTFEHAVIKSAKAAIVV